ncbi:MAG: hypothetical protein FWC89_00840 [Defluviitaleaceae bacterium]|nr:hypothetical protein [Defluviitaleaceae bacterium]
MVILYDMQEQFEAIATGVFYDACNLMPTGSESPFMRVVEVDNVKSLLVENRKNKSAGVGLKVAEIPEIQAGDRITVTGRFSADSPAGNWGVALIAKRTDYSENQLAHQIAPRSVFALSHVLEDDEMQTILMIQTTSWGLQNPLMDFHLDNILISRISADSLAHHDTRGKVYSLAEDPNIQQYSTDTGATRIFLGNAHLRRAGDPTISIFKYGDINAFHVNNRVKDFDAVDIDLESLELIKGNKYQLTVTGRIDGTPPEGSLMMFQGIPGFSWRSNKFAATDSEFILTYTLTPSEVEKWTTIRITTNNIGAPVSFYIYSIEVESLGVF